MLTILNQEELESILNRAISGQESIQTINPISNHIQEKENEPTGILETFCEEYDQNIQKQTTSKCAIATTKQTESNIYTSKKKEQKYLLLSDLHIPFHIEEAVSILKKYGRKGYHLILGGDNIDCHGISVFPKSQFIPLLEEIGIFKSILELCSKLYSEVYIISGNHSRRLSTYLRKRISPEVMSFIQDDMLENIINSLHLKNIKYIPGDMYNWYIQIDNVLIAHPHGGYKKTQMATCVETFNYFDNRHNKSNIFIIGHTHKAGQIVYKNRMLVESGCMCKPQEYALSGDICFNSPEVNSYVTFTSIDNTVDFNSVKLIYI